MSRSGLRAIIINSIVSVGLFHATSLQASPPALDQPGWIRQHPYSEETFKAVDFVDANIRTIVGSGGMSKYLESARLLESNGTLRQ